MRDNKTPYTKSNLTEITVTYSCPIPLRSRKQIQGSYDAVDILRQIWDDKTLEYREQLYVLYLTRSNHMLGYFLHSIGGLSGTIADIKQILGIALKINAASIIMSHNHPSGNARPSNSDKLITKKIVNGASCLDLTVLDNIILTKESFYSFADEGVLPKSDITTTAAAEYYGGYPMSWNTAT